MAKTFGIRAWAIFAFVLLAAFVPISYSLACPMAQRTIFVPAVVTDQEGGLLRASAIVVPGNGTIYTSIEPLVGISTQMSQQEAVSEAFAGTNFSQKDCNVYFEFLDLNGSPSVDGPSAGVAMTVALRAALEGKEIRDDVVITGAIMPGGAAGAVGGIIDKGQAAARNGKKLFVTPKQQLYENILLSRLAEKYNMTAMEVQTMMQAYEIATSPSGQMYLPNFKLENNKVPADLPAQGQDEQDRRFAYVATKINEQLSQQTEQEMSGELEKYKEHFRTEVSQNNEIIAKGYSYTGANNAFLSQIDAAFLTTPPEKLNVSSELEISQKCINNLPNVSATDLNFEWVAGANARARWAQKKIDEVKNASGDIHSQEEEYLAVREAYTSRAWCEAAYYMLLQANDIGGMKLNESEFSSMASEMTANAKSLNEKAIVPDGDAKWHLEIGQKALDEKDYLAAIFDSAYASGMQSATTQEMEGRTGYENQTMMLASKEYGSLWARVYQSQGIYGIYLTGGNVTSGDSARVLNLADAMDNAMEKAKARIANPPISVDVNAAKKADNANPEIVVGALVLILLLALAYLMGMRHERARKKKAKK